MILLPPSIFNCVHPLGEQISPELRSNHASNPAETEKPSLTAYLIHLHVKIQTEEHGPNGLHYSKYSQEAHEHFHDARRCAADGTGCLRAIGFIHPLCTLLGLLQMRCLQVA